jgi:hypothetical protein
MGLPTWAKRKLEENWFASLSKAMTKVEGFSDLGQGENFGFKIKNKFPHKKACHEGEWKPRTRHFKQGKTQTSSKLGFQTQR